MVPARLGDDQSSLLADVLGIDVLGQLVVARLATGLRIVLTGMLAWMGWKEKRSEINLQLLRQFRELDGIHVKTN